MSAIRLFNAGVLVTNAIIAPRRCQTSARWEEFWKSRAIVYPHLCRTHRNRINPHIGTRGCKLGVGNTTGYSKADHSLEFLIPNPQSLTPKPQNGGRVVSDD